MAHVRQEAARHLPSHLTPQRTGHKPRTHTDGQHSATDAQTVTSATDAHTVVTGDGGGFNTKERRCVGRRATSEQCACWLRPKGRARVACIFRLTARVRLLAPSAPVSGLAPAQIPPKGRLGPLREDKSGFCQKSTSRFCVLRHLSIIREFLNGPRPPGGSSASAEPPHSRLHHG